MFNPSRLFWNKQQNNYRSGPADSQPGKYSQHRIAKLNPPTKPIAQSSKPSVTGWQRLITVCRQFFQGWTSRSQLSIQKITNARRDCWWHVTDPRTGKSFYAETFNEAVDWIEAHRLGK